MEICKSTFTLAKKKLFAFPVGVEFFVISRSVNTTAIIMEFAIMVLVIVLNHFLVNFAKK